MNFIETRWNSPSIFNILSEHKQNHFCDILSNKIHLSFYKHILSFIMMKNNITIEISFFPFFKISFHVNNNLIWFKFSIQSLFDTFCGQNQHLHIEYT